MSKERVPKTVVDFRCDCGEGPLWHPEERCLYWVDIPNSKLFSYEPATGEVQTHDTGAPVGGFTIHEDGRLLLFMEEGAVKLWDHGRIQTVIESVPGEEQCLFNDVIADPEGRVFCGSLSAETRPGRLCRVDPDGRVSTMLENTKTANGMGFAPDLEQMYFCDSGTREIAVFDYDRSTGELGNKKVIAVTEESEGIPDGMTVDADGFLWSARWNGHCLVRMDPEGTPVDRVEFPVKKVTCVTFGGDDLTDMYVTTAGGSDQAENGEHAGALFHLNLGIKGRPEFRSRGFGA